MRNIVQEYRQAKAKQFGNLHERMKYLISLLSTHEGTPNEVHHAIYDLETEVENYKPIDPPFGQRIRPAPRSV